MNDPYTTVQAIDHLSVIFCALAVRPLGDNVAEDPTGRGAVSVPGRRFGDYLAMMCDSSAVTALLNTPSRWRCSGYCTIAPTC